jgi:hypothetical protein
MHCDNCGREGDSAFTLTVYPRGGRGTVLVDFCSIECLQAWTSTGDDGIEEWQWVGDPEVSHRARSADGGRPSRRQ